MRQEEKVWPDLERWEDKKEDKKEDFWLAELFRPYLNWEDKFNFLEALTVRANYGYSRSEVESVLGILTPKAPVLRTDRDWHSKPTFFSESLWFWFQTFNFGFIPDKYTENYEQGVLLCTDAVVSPEFTRWLGRR